MPILSKGNTFADGDQVTSTKLNNLVDNATFVSGSSGTTDNATLEVNGSGRLQVKTIQTGNIANSAVTTAKIGDSQVTTAKIADSNVTTAKIADSTGSSDGVTTAKIADDAVTQAKIADAAVGTAQLIDANITAEKLNGAQSGNAPIFGIRAWGFVTGSGVLGANSGIAASSGTNGGYSITLTEPWTQTPIVLVTCVDTTNNFNYSAKISTTSPNLITVRTGFEDTPNLASVGFNIAVIY